MHDPRSLESGMAAGGSSAAARDAREPVMAPATTHARRPRRSAVAPLAMLLGVGLTLALVSCAGPPPDVDDPFGSQRVVDIISSTDPPTGPVDVGGLITIEWVGTGTVVGEAPDEFDDVDDDPADPGDPSTEAPLEDTEWHELAFHVFNPETGNEFLLTFDPDLLQGVFEHQAALGLTDATHEIDDPAAFESPPVPQGWSNGTDDRLMRTATTSWPWRAIAQHGSGDSGCTSTLIGPRHLITAAHCINRRGTSDWYTVRVDPGRNGIDESPFGSSTISTNPPPGTTAWYFTPAAWRTEWCSNNVSACIQWDWGMIVVPDRIGDLTGWMGYWVANYAHLSNQTHYNRGYPKCDTTSPSRPSVCDSSVGGDEQFYWARLFGDISSCTLGGVLHPGPDGWNRTIRHSCDTSGGHSGSALYHYRQRPSGAWVPVVTMVHGNTTCQTCSPAVDFPNRARRITPSDLGVISWLRATFQ